MTTVYRFSASTETGETTYTETEASMLISTRYETITETILLSTTITTTVTAEAGGENTVIRELESLLQIEDIVLTQTIYDMPNGTVMSITLQFSVKNTGDRLLNLTRVEVPGANYSVSINVVLNPGYTYSGTYTVLNKVPYNVEWERGTVHTIIFYYRLLGEAEERIVTFTATVM